MISKNIATELFFKYYDEFSEKERAGDMYDAIRYSIGTCGECAYCDIPHVREPASPCCTINYSSSHYWQEVELNGYCSRFKRKVD